MERGHYALRVSSDLARGRRALHPQIERRLAVLLVPRASARNAAVSQVLANPHAGKPLHLDLAGLWSFRIGRYRLVYRIEPERIVHLLSFGPRETIYEETYRLVVQGAKPRPHGK